MNSNNKKISLDFSHKEDILAWAKSKDLKVPEKLNSWLWLLAFVLFVLTGPLFPLNFIGYGLFIFYRRKVYRDKYRSLFKKWIDAGKPLTINEIVSQDKIQKLKVEEKVEKEVEKKDEKVKINKQMSESEIITKTGIKQEINKNNNSLKEKKDITNQDRTEKNSKKSKVKEKVYKGLKNGEESSSKLLKKDLSPYEFSKEEVFQASVEIAIRRLIITSPEKVSISESERDAPAKYGWEFGHFILKNSQGKKWE